MNYQRQTILVFICLIAFSFLVQGCGNQQPNNTASTGADNLIFTVADPTGDYGFPSPFTHYARGPGYVRMSLIFDTLVWKDDQGYIPALAATWDYNQDEISYIFHLQKNATWHDGQKFTAKDVVFTYEYLKIHPYQTTDTSMIKQIEALNEYEVKFYLHGPYAPFLDVIAGTVPILPEHIWKNVNDPVHFQQKEALIGAGPFKAIDYSKEHGSYLYEAYDGYYQGKPKFRRIKMVKMNMEMAAAALKQGQVDMAQVPAELVKPLAQTGLKILTMPHDWVAKLVINHRQEPFNNKEFRQALADAIDRSSLIETTLRGQGLAASPGLVPSDNDWFNPSLKDLYSYDPAKAQNILSSLGYAKNGPYLEKNGVPLEVELLVGNGGIIGYPGERQGEFVKSQLEKIGIKVSLRTLESKTLDSRLNDWKFELALNGHGGLGADPDYLTKNIIGKGFNSARFQANETLAALLSKQVAVMDIIARRQLIDQVQAAYASEVPALPLYYPTWYYAYNPKTTLFFTKQGIGSGVPMPLNKLSFIK
ncbi:MAG TPA: ABC transporter substrate-binding protein [Methylomusa anaerophila]|uniref:Heme-binding protein A n=1 Tax=Methylomusa anaerophila TaxID=1930071 RepID=A0A348AEZ7_9FIRM|nr:ABC transporter substrate-binding protein [Methylomusa anaerophila]BBB89645.1 heme-binding protein A precursor [Methylomusa anaerophila]HML89579.1 ABC transporter substrate-binding protein [Methylomusa anaerophila]